MCTVRNILILVALLVTMMVVYAYADQSVAAPSAEIKTSLDKAPKAVFPEVKYTFDPVFEGAEIKHDFIVENKGDAPLVILSIRPD